jgi:endogenous inhibitor of DNA gyrase (YacG/DUF329 family)
MADIEPTEPERFNTRQRIDITQRGDSEPKYITDDPIDMNCPTCAGGMNTLGESRGYMLLWCPRCGTAVRDLDEDEPNEIYVPEETTGR